MVHKDFFNEMKISIDPPNDDRNFLFVDKNRLRYLDMKTLKDFPPFPCGSRLLVKKVSKIFFWCEDARCSFAFNSKKDDEEII